MFNIDIKLDNGRKDIFRFFSYFIVVVYYGVSVLHFVLGKRIFFGFLDLILGSIVLLNYLLLKDKKFSMDILNIQFIIISFFLLSKGGIYHMGMNWMVVFPAIFFISAGVKKGIFYSFIEISLLVLFIILKHFNIIEIFYSEEQLAFAILITSILAIAIYIYEVNIEKQAKKQQELINEIQNFNIQLQEKIDDKVKEIQQKDQLILTQSKFAIMGEMLSMIAHQWRQPLNNLSLLLMNIEVKIELNEIDTKDFRESMSKAENTIQHLSGTIDDFRELMKPTKNKFSFSVAQYIKKALELSESQMINHNVNVKFVEKDDFTLLGNANEFMQIILNLISNSKDALENVDSKEIDIIIYSQENKKIIKFCDNGSGIKDEFKEKIFEPYFSTKSKNGTGIGLYMSKVLIEKMNGHICYKNIENKTCFVLEFGENDLKGEK